MIAEIKKLWRCFFKTTTKKFSDEVSSIVYCNEYENQQYVESLVSVIVNIYCPDETECVELLSNLRSDSSWRSYF